MTLLLLSTLDSTSFLKELIESSYLIRAFYVHLDLISFKLLSDNSSNSESSFLLVLASLIKIELLLSC